MKTSRMCALSLVAAFAFGANNAEAQIRVTKDTVVTRSTSTGEVTPMATPTPAPAPVEVRTVVTDTLVETTTVAEVIPVRRALIGHNLYVGLGGGVNMPTGDLRQGYGTGFNATGVLGWEPAASPIGLRGTVSFGQFKGGDLKGSSTAQNPDAQIWSALGHAKLRIPFGGLYLIGGGGWNQIRNYNSAAFETGTATGPYVTVNNWSVDGGAGVDIPIGIASLFIEGRMTRVFSSDATTPSASTNRNTGFAPLIIGFRVF